LSGRDPAEASATGAGLAAWTVTDHVTRREPHLRRGSSSWMPATAAIDNETLDHLLSVVDDATNLGGAVRFAKAGLWSVSDRTSSPALRTIRLRPEQV